MKALLDLAERCEAAEGSDRELDAMIAVATDFVAENSNPPSARGLHHDHGGSNSYADIAAHWPRLPRYTGSLDAALTLVPEGWGYSLCPNSALLTRGVSYVGVMGRSSTPALALCAAAVRARVAGADA